MNPATSLSTMKRWTLVVVCAATAMLMLDIAVVNTALSRIADDLDTGLSGLQWVVDAYTLALASVVLTAGALADRFGRRPVILLSNLGLGLDYIVMALAPVFFVLLLGFAAGRFRIVDGHHVDGLNALVMDFALPASLFAATASASRRRWSRSRAPDRSRPGR